MNTQTPTTGLRLLVADDNAVSRMIAAGLAEKLGHAADLAADGEQALRMLAARDYDLVLMDCEMPQLDGYEAVRRLREREGDGRRTPVVALSAALGEEERLACLEAGMDDFLCKPLGLNDLAQAVARLRAAPADALPPAAPMNTPEAVARHFGARYAELANLWLDDYPVRLAMLRDALADADLPRAAGIAHALSGGCASIGAHAASEQCLAIEAAARSGTAPDLAEKLTRLGSACEDVAKRLAEMLQSPAGS